MKKYLVCIVSEQTIPTILFLQEMLQMHRVENIFFLLTEYSQKMMKNILQAIPEIETKSVPLVLEMPNSIKVIKKNLDKYFDDGKYAQALFLVDITGGTKIMSISVYEFFKEYSSEIYYNYIHNETYRKIYPGNQTEEIDFKYRIPLDVYLKAYGTELVSRSKTEPDINVLHHVYRWYEKLENRKIVSRLRDEFQKKQTKYKKPEDRKKPYFPVEIIPGLHDICTICQFTEKQLSIVQIEFLIGGWFEEYIFFYIKKLVPESVTMNCHIKKYLSEHEKRGDIIFLETKKSASGKKEYIENEFDVMFVLRNSLYIIEAKTNFKGRIGLENDTLYKIKALEKDFGIRTKSIIATLDSDIAGKESFIRRARIMDIKLLFSEQLIPGKIVNSLKEMLKIK